MMSLITPPVAVAAFFAAGIAKATPMMTGWTCMRVGWTAYVVPFLFVVSPSLLFNGAVIDVVLAMGTAIVGVYFTSTALIGYFTEPLGLYRRSGFIIAGILLLVPHEIANWGIWTDVLGIFIGGLTAMPVLLQVKEKCRLQKK